jgi:archaellum component FlaG (FlaF/FlaG flagellin family)
MARSIFILFIVAIIILATFLGYSTYNVHYLIKVNEKTSKTLDSLRDENEMLKMNLDKQIFIINQIQELHPKEVTQIINDTE